MVFFSYLDLGLGLFFWQKTDAVHLNLDLCNHVGLSLDQIFSPGAHLLDHVTILVRDRICGHLHISWVESAPLRRPHMVKLVKPLTQVNQRVAIVQDG